MPEDGADFPGASSERKSSQDDESATLLKPDIATQNAEMDVPEPWQVGDVILDTYEVKTRLGEGVFGKVHKVHHKGWNTDLAVKSAKPPFDEEAIKSEAEVWMELGLHPNTVSCFFVRNLGGIPRIFIECVEGGSLEEWLYGKKEYDQDGNERQVALARELTHAQPLAIAIEICRGMHHAHTFEW